MEIDENPKPTPIIRALERENDSTCTKIEEKDWTATYHFENGESTKVPITRFGNTLLAERIGEHAMDSNLGGVLYQRLEDMNVRLDDFSNYALDEMEPFIEDVDVRPYMEEIIEEHNFEWHSLNTSESKEMTYEGEKMSTMGPHLVIHGDFKHLVVEESGLYYEKWIEVARQSLEEP